ILSIIILILFILIFKINAKRKEVVATIKSDEDISFSTDQTHIIEEIVAKKVIDSTEEITIVKEEKIFNQKIILKNNNVKVSEDGELLIFKPQMLNDKNKNIIQKESIEKETGILTIVPKTSKKTKIQTSEKTKITKLKQKFRRVPKKELVESMHSEINYNFNENIDVNNYSKRLINDFIDALGEEISNKIINGDYVTLQKFVSISTYKSKPRTARNLQTGEEIFIPSKIKVKAKFSKIIKDSIVSPNKKELVIHDKKIIHNINPNVTKNEILNNNKILFNNNFTKDELILIAKENKLSVSSNMNKDEIIEEMKFLSSKPFIKEKREKEGDK
ncbi:MAG: HU family DNA-binding protein, partial [Mollicutes bacterium PWAP]|nr:HU family DNA-binding protein [Mollicutes bacterium PWAP]